MNKFLSKILIAALSVLVFGCSSDNPNIVGLYTSKDFNIASKTCYYFRNIRTTSGISLELKSDSTFSFQTCGNIIDGNWKTAKDSLFLFCKNNKYRIDSLNIVGYNGRFAKCNEKPRAFLIDGNVLKNSWEKNGRAYLNYLQKEE